MKPLLEIVAFDPRSALIAADEGADRIELCMDASVGGLTPPIEWIRSVSARVSVPVMVMIRPRACSFVFSAQEHARMRFDALLALEAGAAGIVWGALRPDGAIAARPLRSLVEAVAPNPVTFHRAFDGIPDPLKALATLHRYGVARLLTSAGAPTAQEGVPCLSVLVQHAGDGLRVMPGGGIRSGNVAEIIQRTGAREVHSAATVKGQAVVNGKEVRRLRAVIDALA